MLTPVRDELTTSPRVKASGHSYRGVHVSLIIKITTVQGWSVGKEQEAGLHLLPGAPAWQTPASLLLKTLSQVRAESEGGSLGFLIQKTSTEILQDLSIFPELTLNTIWLWLSQRAWEGAT